jgi:hypothetical protein
VTLRNDIPPPRRSSAERSLRKSHSLWFEKYYVDFEKYYVDKERVE